MFGHAPIARQRWVGSAEYQIEASDIVERRQEELSLGMFLDVFRECLGQQWVPEEVHFEHPHPGRKIARTMSGRLAHRPTFPSVATLCCFARRCSIAHAA